MPAAPGSRGSENTTDWFRYIATQIGNFFSAAGAILNIGSNSITTTTYTISEQTSIIAAEPGIRISPTTGNNNVRFELLPSGTGNVTEIDLFQNSDTATTPFAYISVNTAGVAFGADKRNVTSPPDLFLQTQNRVWQFDDSTGAIVYTAITDPAAAAGQAWLSSTNADVWKYSNGSTLYSLTSTKSTTNTATAASPTGTTSATAVMMAVGGALTPANTGRVLITISGQVSNNTINDGATVQLRYGTGTAPNNGDAVTGTQVGISQTFTALVAAQRDGFCISGVVTGLTLGTAIWIDAALNRETGGTASMTGVTCTTAEF